MRDTGKDEAEFILIVGKFKTHYGDHREAGPWDPGGGAPHVGGKSHTFVTASPTMSPTDYEDPEPRSWVRVGWGREEDRVLPGSCPDHVSDFHRKKEQLGYIVI